MVNSVAQSLKGRLYKNESMARHTSWRLGGDARSYYVPASCEDLCVFLRSLPKQEVIYFVGLGSNILVRDAGIAGTVIGLQGVLEEMHMVNASTVYAEAGVSCAKLARFSVEHGLTGGEFFAGIPGTVGGALAMNAGAFGGETWRYVVKVKMVDRQGGLAEHGSEKFDVSYRAVTGYSQSWFVAGLFRFDKDMTGNGRQTIRKFLSMRGATQPIGQNSCGSVFRNPEGDYAARLIEAVGLKGYRLGGAYVSEKHANFMINDGSASAGEMEDLITYVQAKVQEKFGICLQTEVKIIGEKT